MKATNNMVKQVISMEKQSGSGSGLLEFLEEWSENKEPPAISMTRYLEGKARKKGMPFKATFELTPRCNLDCKMCYVHLTDTQLKTHPERMLSGTEWIRIMQDAVENGLLYALLTGGEAMLHPDFEELYIYLCEHGVRVTVTTNGLLLTEEKIALFQKYRPLEIRVTLYGADDDSYENVTGKRVFHHVISNIHRAKNAGIPLAVVVTPSRYLKNHLKETIHLMASLGVKAALNAGLSTPRPETGRASVEHDMSVEDYIHIRKWIHEYGGTPLTGICEEDTPLPGGNTDGEKKGFRCGGGRSSFAVIWHGKMQPCLSFDKCQVDLSCTTFDEAWKKINSFVKEYPVPRECFGCPYEMFCPVCVVHHAEGAPIGHANPALCERAKRFAQEGLYQLK